MQHENKQNLGNVQDANIFLVKVNWESIKTEVNAKKISLKLFQIKFLYEDANIYEDAN